MNANIVDSDSTSLRPAFASPRVFKQGSVWPAEPTASATADARIPWAAYWRSIRKRRWRILFMVALTTLLTALYVQSIEPVYRSTATLLIESGKTKILSIEEVYNAVSQDREYYQTQVEILRSRDVALRTVIASKLWDEAEFDPRKPVRSWRGLLKDFVSPPPAPLPWTTQRLAEATVGKFLGAVSIEPVRLSQLVKISFDAQDKDLAARMANATATSFIEADRDARLKLNLSVTGLLQERLIALREKVMQSEQELQQFRERGGLVSSSGSQGIAGQQMADLAQRLVAARVRRTELESANQQVEKVSDGDYSGVPGVIGQSGVAESRNRVALAAMQLDQLSRTLGDAHVRVIEARAGLAAAQRQLTAQTRAVITSFRREVQAARETERALEAALAGARSAVQGVNRQEFQLGVLEREVQTNKQLYELFLSRAKETSVSTNLQAAVARLIDSASPATAPLRPNKTQAITMALVLSMGSLCLYFILRDRLNNTLQGSEEAEHRLHQPVLATLPAIHPMEAFGGLTRSFVDDPKSGHSEAIRAARTSILLSKFDVARKQVLVTSALPGEGKTTFCTNLAFAHAQTKRTLLIDCNLRNPQIGAQLGLPDDARGIVDLALGRADMKECVHAISGSSLLVMPAGELPSNPEEFLLSSQFRATMKSLANRVDIVLIDSSPVATCSDVLIISQQVSDTIYVVKAHDTPHRLAHKGLEQLQRAGASILGVVLSHMEMPQQSKAASRRTAGLSAFEDTRDAVASTMFGA